MSGATVDTIPARGRLSPLLTLYGGKKLQSIVFFFLLAHVSAFSVQQKPILMWRPKLLAAMPETASSWKTRPTAKSYTDGAVGPLLD